MKNEKVLVICSGGLDSVVMASIYDRKGDDFTLMTFDYGQKGKKEIEIVRKFADYFCVDLKVIDISFMKDLFGQNQLSSDDIKIEGSYNQSVVVPLRNAVFLQIAMVYAYSNGFDKIALGSHLDDITEIDGERCYPDCSPEFFKSFELAMDLGTFRSDKTVRIESASILKLTKKDLMIMGYRNLENLIFDTWSCYESNKLQCGQCESCRNRKKFFKEAGIEDKTIYLIN